MLKKGQKVLIKKDLPWGKDIHVEGVEHEEFFLPIEAKPLGGSLVTITKVQSWMTNAEGDLVYYYRVDADKGSYGWLESFLEPVELNNIILISLKDGNFIVIRRENLLEVIPVDKYSTLSEEIKNKSTIY